MAEWKRILVEGDAVTSNLATANLTQSGSPRTYDVGSSQVLNFEDGTVNFKNSSSATKVQISANSTNVIALLAGGALQFNDSDNTNSCTIDVPSNITSNYTITLPSAGPGGTKILQSDVNGDLSWIDTPSGGGGTIDGSGAANRVAYWSDADTLTSSGDLIFDGTDLRVTNSVIASELDANTINAEVTGLSADGDLGRGAELLKVATSFATTAGRMYYVNSSSSWSAADKDVEAAADGFLVVASGTNATDGMLIRGIMRLGSGAIGGTPAVGDKLYLSDNGTFTVDTSAYTTGDFVRAVGHYIATNTIYFNPSQEYIELA